MATHTPKPNSLHEAVYNKDIERVKLLIKQGVDVNEKGKKKETPLFWLQKDDIKMAELLIKHGADVNVRAVFTAFFGEDLIERTGPTPLLATIKKDSDEKIVSLLIKSGAEVAKDSLLYVRSFEVAKLLVENGADVNTKDNKGETPLIKLKWNFKIVKLLIENGAIIKTKGYTALHRQHNPQTVKYLIEHGADVNAKTGYGDTPLHGLWVEEVTRVLIKHGADVNAKNSHGKTPLHTVKKNVKIAKILIENGANVNAINNEGDTPCNTAYSKEVRNLIKEKGGFCRNLINLHKFVISRDKARVKLSMEYHSSGLINWLLRTKKSALNARENKYGNTPLHFAKDLEIAKILIDNGANINAINNKGQTPFDTIDSEEVKKYIKENGGKSGLALDKKESLYNKVKNLFKKKEDK